MQTVSEVREALQRGTERVTSLASLVRVAIEDGRAMLKDRPEVNPDYGIWWRRNEHTGRCVACLAGAVMLGTLDGLGKHRLENCDLVNSDALQIMYTGDQVAALCALDRTRQGNLFGAYRVLDPDRWSRDIEFRDAVERFEFKRRKGSKTNRVSAPGSFFTTRGEFETHLDGLETLADELEAFEFAHLGQEAEA